ncbi:MAG: hypothetical protein ACRC7N_02560 [Clostridium sp.]
MKKKLFWIIEMGIPILIIILSFIFLFIDLSLYFPQIYTKLNDILKEIIKNLTSISALVSTMATVFCAIVITSLSVFGSTRSYSTVTLSQSKLAVQKFIVYAFLSLFGSLILLIFSLIYFLIPIKLYIFVFNFTLASIWAYTFFSIYMFYKNISYIGKDNKSEIQMLQQIVRIKKDVSTIKESLERIEKNK